MGVLAFNTMSFYEGHRSWSDKRFRTRQDDHLASLSLFFFFFFLLFSLLLSFSFLSFLSFLSFFFLLFSFFLLPLSLFDFLGFSPFVCSDFS